MIEAGQVQAPPDETALEFSFTVTVRLAEEVPGVQTPQILAEALREHLQDECNPRELVWIEDGGGYWTVESWNVARTGG